MQTRIIALTDFFEALIAKDRPYKKPIPLEKALEIMEGAAKDNHIDRTLFEFFKEKKIYEKIDSIKQSMDSRILIIDDDEDMVKLLDHKLEKEGYEIITAIDGNAGLEKARKERPSMILLDIVMQGKNGIQICSEFKKDSLTKAIPLIMMSAVKDVEIKVALLESGADDYITKPFDFKELLARIQALIRRAGNKTRETFF